MFYLLKQYRVALYIQCTTNAMELLLLQKAYPVRCGLTEKLLLSIIIIIILLLL